MAAKGRTICCIGNCLQAMRQLDKSIEFYTSAMKVAEELNDQLGQAIVFGNLGILYRKFSIMCTKGYSKFIILSTVDIGYKNTPVIRTYRLKEHTGYMNTPVIRTYRLKEHFCGKRIIYIYTPI